MNLRDEENPVEANIEQEMDKPRRTMTANGARQWRRGALLGEGGGGRGTGRRRAGRRWGPGEAGRGPGRRGFRAAAGAQDGGGGVCVSA